MTQTKTANDWRAAAIDERELALWIALGVSEWVLVMTVAADGLVTVQAFNRFMADGYDWVAGFTAPWSQVIRFIEIIETTGCVRYFVRG